jgi:mono/diheme cytochrome c family protein
VTHRGGLPPTDDPWGDDATTLRHLEQNWGPIEGIWFYFGSQGSRLIRRDLLLNLEVADGERPLAGPETWARYRLLAQEPSPNNPDGLPVGFTRDGDAIGLTCAACHTGQFVYEGAAVRVDGAPALMDMNGLLSAFEASVDATLADEAKLGRLLVALGASGDAEAEAAGRRHLQQAQLFLRSYNADFASNPGGYGRIDAIGGILNQVVRVTSGPGHSVPADAPTSYPLIWDAPRHDWVQWTAFSSNGGPGSLARNTGEVVGVFGELHVTGVHDEADNRGGYDTSIKAHNLVDLEETVWKLQSPVWPEDVLPPIDRDRAARGAAVYAETCLGCHALLDRDDPKRRVVAQVIDVETVGTDPRTADNLIGAVVPTGTLEGSLTPDGLAVLGPEASALDMIIMVSGNALKSNKAAVVRTLANAKRWGLEESPKQGMVPADTPDAPLGSLRAYKARPLNGVWASAPYLHNGSVPTLYDLMLPEEQRPARFAVGRWTFDPVRVGYVTDGEAPGVFDTTVPGNHNTGHRFGAALSDADRWALVEYLKTL